MSDPTDDPSPAAGPIDLASFEGHTPGPWHANSKSVDNFGNDYPCSLSMEWITNGTGRYNANHKADARLIAAAPALLARVAALESELAKERAVVDSFLSDKAAALDIASRYGFPEDGLSEDLYEDVPAIIGLIGEAYNSMLSERAELYAEVAELKRKLTAGPEPEEPADG